MPDIEAQLGISETEMESSEPNPVDAPKSLEVHKISPKPRALFRQPLALQWREGNKIMRRIDGERQAGKN